MARPKRLGSYIKIDNKKIDDKAAFETKIAIEVENFYSKSLNNKRKIEIFLPPGYNTSNTSTRYKVLYANDGQDMSSLELKKTLEDLYASQKIEKIIVVAIYATSERTREYGTAGIPNAQGLGNKAAAYNQFVISEVMPYINHTFLTLEGAANTAIMGASLGGLAAFDMAWHQPDLFGKVGVFSGSFWWRTDDTNVTTKQNSRIMHKIVRNSSKRPQLKFWFEAGTQDETSDRDGNGVIDAIQDTTELMDELRLKGYQPGLDMVYVQVKDGKHNQQTWAKVLPDFLKWAFPL